MTKKVRVKCPHCNWNTIIPLLPAQGIIRCAYPGCGKYLSILERQFCKIPGSFEILSEEKFYHLQNR